VCFANSHASHNKFFTLHCLDRVEKKYYLRLQKKDALNDYATSIEKEEAEMMKRRKEERDKKRREVLCV